MNHGLFAGSQGTTAVLPEQPVHAPAQAQINARIDRGVKQAGDEALARAGFTPSQAIRALWNLAARFSAEPDRIVQALDPDAHLASESAAEECERKRALAREGANIVGTYRAERGLGRGDAQLANLPYREYRDALMSEHYAEKGLLHG